MPAGGLAGGWSAAGGVQGRLALDLVRDCQRADQVVPFGGGEAGQGGVRPVGVLGPADGGGGGGTGGSGRRV